MSISYSPTSIDNLKDRVDIVDVIGQVVQLKRAGANYKGLCPFHNEKTPSFSVSQSRQHFHCFGCGAKGDVIEFVMRYRNLSFPEAVEKLAEEHGIEMEVARTVDNRKEYYEINRMAARFFYRSFTEVKNPGYPYMKNRGISDQTLKRFGIGYADREWDSLYRHLHAQGIPDDKMEELGLVSKGRNGKYYDKFRNRVIFPIFDISGRVIGFGGRAISPEDNPKYLNSPESKIFRKKDNLYALNFSRQDAGKAGYLILVEGYMDVISVYQAGIRNVAASLGTALTEQQAHLIHNRCCKDVVLSYDADQAGRNAALRGIEILKKQGIRVRVLHVTDGKDPDEYIKQYGKDAFLKLVDSALSYGDYKLASAQIGLDLTDDEQKTEFARRALAMIADMSPVEQSVYKDKIAELTGIAVTALDQEMSLQASGRKERRQTRRRDAEEEESRTEVSPLERSIIRLLMMDPSYGEKVRRGMLGRFGPVLQKVILLAAKYQDQPDYVWNEALIDEADEYAELLMQIRRDTNIDPDPKVAFDKCMRDVQQQELVRQEGQIRHLLDRSDEEEDQEAIRELMERLKIIQRKRKTLLFEENEGDE